MTDDTIYIALLDEGLDVWRPVKARRVSPDRYLILDQEYDRDAETWAYEPGTVVECRTELRNAQERIFAVGSAEQDRKNSVMHKALVWEGQLRVSLVSCPVSLYAATTDGMDRPDQIQTGDINIEYFVEEEQIDPVYLGQPHHLVPRGALAEETFTVFLEAMRRKRLAALCSVSFQGIGRKVALFTGRNTLRAYVLRYKREVLEEHLFAAQLETARPDQEMLDLATRLLDNKKGRFIPVDELPETKQETALKEGIRAGKVVSLDDALRKSLEARSVVIRSNSRRTGGSK